jgi:hypothetical protein
VNKVVIECYSQVLIMAFIMQPPFQFQSASHHTRHLILAPAITLGSALAAAEMWDVTFILLGKVFKC